jgi:hypothetical protein
MDERKERTGEYAAEHELPWAGNGLGSGAVDAYRELIAFVTVVADWSARRRTMIPAWDPGGFA